MNHCNARPHRSLAHLKCAVPFEERDMTDLDATDVFPAQTPDLFVGRPVILTGRFDGDPNATVTVRESPRRSWTVPRVPWPRSS